MLVDETCPFLFVRALLSKEFIYHCCCYLSVDVFHNFNGFVAILILIDLLIMLFHNIGIGDSDYIMCLPFSYLILYNVVGTSDMKMLTGHV